MSTLHCTAISTNTAKIAASVGQSLNTARGRAVVPNLQLQLASPHIHRHQLLRCRSNGDALQATTDKQKISIDVEPQAEGEYCMPGEVLLDNESHKQFTILRVEVRDYPGLLRVCAWVLNGLQLFVQNARYNCADFALGLCVNQKTSSNTNNCDIVPSGSQPRMALPTTSSGSRQTTGAS